MRSDALTGLHNRRRFQHILEAEITRQVRYGGTFSIVAIDLNDFKNLNDREGHHAGDQALILLATTLVKKTRQSDSIARLGGDEFAILLPQTNDENCNRLREQLTIDIEHAMIGHGFPISASVGYVTFNHALSSTSIALQAADKAMYAVKLVSKTR